MIVCILRGGLTFFFIHFVEDRIHMQSEKYIISTFLYSFAIFFSYTLYTLHIHCGRRKKDVKKKHYKLMHFRPPTGNVINDVLY